ncbi:hypothetical protein H4R18_005577 [Coemansia javaensis]|uniref:UBC core domain-containing protein n=1 Tax=Coemansia javaensis TaxID=2761396 RepID=A0A9W8LD40_9FUNG|nr:hypothetical protein H4R18_005577 [Coemansia javaensis]
MASAVIAKRLMGELRRMEQEPPAFVTLAACSDLDTWFVDIDGAEKTLYAGERFSLRFRFPATYPFEAPEVVFVGKAPVHPHIYSNGHICLSILYTQWSPALTVETICLSILSMLSSCERKEPPAGDKRYVLTAAASPKDTVWQFDGNRARRWGLGRLLAGFAFPRVYVAAVLVLAAAFVIAESYILYLTKRGHRAALANQWQVPGVQKVVTTSMGTYMVYNALLIVAQAYVVFLCLEAHAHKDLIQVVVVVAIYFICFVLATTRLVAFYVYPSVAARMFKRNSNMKLMQSTVVALYAIALPALAVLSNKLRKEVGWGVFRRLGADAVLHRAHMWRQILMMLLRLDIYFVGSYLVQLSALVLKVDDAETWLQMTVFIPFCIVVIVGAFYAVHNEHRPLMTCVSAALFLSVGYFIFKIYRVCRPSILNKPEDPYSDARPFFMITIIVCMLLVIGTCVASVMCIRSFDSGLKEAIAYDKMRTRHMQMYATEKECREEENPLVPNPAGPRMSVRERGNLTLD